MLTTNPKFHVGNTVKSEIWGFQGKVESVKSTDGETSYSGNISNADGKVVALFAHKESDLQLVTRFNAGEIVQSKRWNWVGVVNRIETNDTGIYYYGDILFDASSDIVSDYTRNGKVANDPRFCHLEDELQQYRAFVPHRNEAGTITEIFNEGKSVRMMLDSRTAIQVRTMDIQPIKEERNFFSNEQAQNSPVDDSQVEAPKTKQLEMF